MKTNCRKLTPFGRRLLVDRILELGWPAARAAESVGVSRQTAYRWMRRFQEEGEAGLEDRSSRPRHSPGRVSSEMEKRIVSDRITEKEGPHLMAGRLGVPRSTIYGVLARRGLSRLSDLDRTTGTPIRYVRDCPGELVHVDIKKLGRIPDGGGWRVLGRSQAGPKQKVGYEYVHSMVDDHTRMAYSQSPRLPGRPNLRRVHATRRSVVRHLRVSHRPGNDRQRHGLPPKPSLRRCSFGDRRRSQTDPTLPSRFHQTLLRGWAYKQPYTTNQQRRQALTRFLRTYNHRRPHSSLGGQPPITQLVTHLCGKDT